MILILNSCSIIMNYALIILIGSLFPNDCPALVKSREQEDLDLPAHHAAIINHNSRSRAAVCDGPMCAANDKDTLIYNSSAGCFGYEPGCDIDNGFHPLLDCPKSSKWPNAKTKSSQLRLFWEQTDFGYVKQRLSEIESLCVSTEEKGSRLECVDHLRYCYARNIFFKFNSFVGRQDHRKYRNDVLENGEVGGNCQINRKRLIDLADHKSFLQSWAEELIHFQASVDFVLDADHCDIIFDKPSVIIKLDAGVSMFHHFCDFVNLYSSQHINGSFSKDVQIIFWESSRNGYHDLFQPMWEVFTNLPIIQLNTLLGKQVCFREAMLPLLARMQYGMYYNMPMVDGCHGSGLFHAFSNHVMHRLRISQDGPLLNKIRITIQARSTTYRQILNAEELTNALKTVQEFDVNLVYFNTKMDLRTQFKFSHNSDILIGMHGSGLTHLLFLPDWAAVFEINNCGDPNCYRDLAHLRGVKYYTWEKDSKLSTEGASSNPDHQRSLGKFVNYRFDVDEFMRIVNIAADYVRNSLHFLNAREEIVANQQNKIQELNSGNLNKDEL